MRHSQVEKPHDTQQPWKSHEIDVDTKVYQTQVTQQEGNRSVPQGQTNVMQMANVQQRTPSFTQPNGMKMIFFSHITLCKCLRLISMSLEGAVYLSLCPSFLNLSSSLIKFKKHCLIFVQ